MKTGKIALKLDDLIGKFFYYRFKARVLTIRTIHFSPIVKYPVILKLYKLITA